MKEFEYVAEDQAHQTVTGRVLAPSSSEALKQISERGLRLRRLRPAESAFQTPPAQVTPPTVRASVSSPAARAQSGEIVRTRPASYKTQYLFFLQLSELLRGGIDPAQAFRSLGTRFGFGPIRDACASIAPRLVEGRRISDELARYPDLFPPGVVGGVRSGEESGNLPEACSVVAHQREESHRFDVGFWWARLAFWNVLLGIPLVYPMIGILEKAFAPLIDSSAASQMEGMTLMERIGSNFSGYWQRVLDPFPLVMWILVLFSIWWWWAMKRSFTMPLRHKLALTLPGIKGRTLGENMMLFSWHLSKLTSAGLSPWRAYSLAADAVPNLAYSERLKEGVSGMNDQTSLAAVFGQVQVIPDEWKSMIGTGEMTGTLPATLERASKFGQEEAKRSGTAVRFRMGCWAMLVTIGFGLLAFGFVYGYYGRMALKILE